MSTNLALAVPAAVDKLPFMLRFWPMRFLLYLAGLAVGGAAGMGAYQTLGAPYAPVIGAAFWFAFSLPISRICLAVVDAGRYFKGLFYPFWPLATVGALVAQAGQQAAQINPEAPDMAAGLMAVLTGPGLAIALVAGPVGALVLCLPAVVGIGDNSTALGEMMAQHRQAEAEEAAGVEPDAAPYAAPESQWGAATAQTRPALAAAPAPADHPPAGASGEAATVDPFWFLFGEDEEAETAWPERPGRPHPAADA
jgi:hypothetical protein